MMCKRTFLLGLMCLSSAACVVEHDGAAPPSPVATHAEPVTAGGWPANTTAERCSDVVERQSWVGDYGMQQGWDYDRPRTLADVNGDGKADIVAFGGDGTYVSLSTGEGFQARQLWVAAYGANAGGWDPAKHLRVLADVNGDGRDDVVGFGNSGVSVSRSTGATFMAPEPWTPNYGYDASAGSWRISNHIRVLADVNGDKRADIVGFGNSATVVSLSTGTGFTDPATWSEDFGFDDGWQLPNQRPRMLADMNGDGLDDVVGFKNAGTYVSLSTGSTFMDPVLWAPSYAINQGFLTQQSTPRVLADVNGDGRKDVVAFGSSAVWVSTSTGNGLTAQAVWVSSFTDAQGWSPFPRYLTDVNGDGNADVVGYSDSGVWISASSGDGFDAPVHASDSYGASEGWTSHPRMLGDVNGDGAADVVGFGNTSVEVSLSACPRVSIPLRVSQLLPCDPEVAPCAPYAQATDMQASIERANGIWKVTGIEYWLESDDMHYAERLNTVESPVEETFVRVRPELQDIYPNIPDDAYAAGATKFREFWLNAAAAFYADVNSVPVFVLDTNGKSRGAWPWIGRAIRWKKEAAANPASGEPSSHLPHELGHFMGLMHPDQETGFDVRTNFTSRYSECDMWDLFYRPAFGPFTEQFFSGPYDPACTDTFVPPRRNIGIDTLITGTDPFAVFHGELAGQSYAAGSDPMKGILFDTGLPQNAPDTYSWGFNVMNPPNFVVEDGGKLNGATPRFISKSQQRVIQHNLAKSATYRQGPLTGSVSDEDNGYAHMMDVGGGLPKGTIPDALSSARTKLGKASDDFFWWSNAQFVDDGSFTYERRDVSNGYQPFAGDFDNNHYDDILWYNPKDGTTTIWWFDANGFQNISGPNFGVAARPFVGDFDGNHADDVFVYRPGSASDAIQFGIGNHQFQAVARVATSQYRPFAGDFDDDNDDDIAWYHPTNGTLTIAWSNPTGVAAVTFQSSVQETVGDGLPYRPLVGNFDGQFGDDIYWFRPGAGTDLTWRNTGTTTMGKFEAWTHHSGERNPFVGDFTGDNKDDIFWDSPGIEHDYIRPGRSISPSNGSWKAFDDPLAESIPGTFQPVTGDFDHDNDSDVFWYRRY